MSDLNSQELRIVGFLCNWCSYGGADTAGVARAKQPTDLRIIRLPCSGRVDPLFVLKALFNGADGVLVSGCHPRDCHYSSGNFYARRRLQVVKEFLPILGIDSRRFEYTWVSASEGQRWQEVVTKFTAQIHELGKATTFAEIEPKAQTLPPLESRPQSLQPLNCGQDAPLASLKAAIAERLVELDLVIGWQEGRDKAHAVPLFMREKADVERLIFGPFNVQNLATYLPEYKGKKIGIVVKACDVRSVMELLQENLIEREQVTLFTIPCGGTFDMGGVEAKLGRYENIDKVKINATTVEITADGHEHTFDISKDAQGKCLSCTCRLSSQADVILGGEADPNAKPFDPTFVPRELALLESLSLEDRMAFWKWTISRCIRCGACRNSCPMCVCRDHCVSALVDAG